MSRNIKVDFYQVETPADTNFSDMLQYLNTLPIGERILPDFTSPVRLQEVRLERVYIEGDMIRIRMDEVPLKASLAGETAYIDLEDDEGIGEDTAFLYYVPFNVLLLQKNKYGVSASAFAHYCKRKCDADYVFFNPILRTDVLQRLVQMTVIRKFDVKIAGVENSEIFRGQDQGINSLIDLKDEFEAPDVSVTMSMGRRRGSLSVETIKSLITSLLQIRHTNTKQVKILDVIGQEDSTSESETLDILNARIVEQISVDMDGNRRLSYESRRTALRDAWRLRQTELGIRFRRRDV